MKVTNPKKKMTFSEFLDRFESMIDVLEIYGEYGEEIDEADVPENSIVKSYSQNAGIFNVVIANL